jgi:hypothetical protein
LKSTAGLTKVEFEENRFEERFISSKYLISLRSSGKVAKLFPYKSSVFNLEIAYKFLILAGVMELYERFKTSNLGKSSLTSGGTD